MGKLSKLEMFDVIVLKPENYVYDNDISRQSAYVVLYVEDGKDKYHINAGLLRINDYRTISRFNYLLSKNQPFPKAWKIYTSIVKNLATSDIIKVDTIPRYNQMNIALKAKKSIILDEFYSMRCGTDFDRYILARITILIGRYIAEEYVSSESDIYVLLYKTTAVYSPNYELDIDPRYIGNTYVKLPEILDYVYDNTYWNYTDDEPICRKVKGACMTKREMALIVDDPLSSKEFLDTYRHSSDTNTRKLYVMSAREMKQLVKLIIEKYRII